MSDVSIVVRTPAGSEPRVVTTGTTAADLFEGDRSIVVAKVNDVLRDLAHELHDGDVVEPVTIDSPDGLGILRHSAAHVLAQAVQPINPRRSSESARRSPTASTTTSASPSRSLPRPQILRQRDGANHPRRPAFVAASSPTTRRAPSS